MATTIQDLADALKAAQGPAEDEAIQDAANLVTAEGIWNFLTQQMTVAVGIPVATTGTAAAQTGATTAPGALV